MRVADVGGEEFDVAPAGRLRLRLWQAAEDTAVQVFAGNLRDLLLAAPAGARPPAVASGAPMSIAPDRVEVRSPTALVSPPVWHPTVIETKKES